MKNFSNIKIGILGAGQLGKMLSLAAANLDIQTLCYAESFSNPASSITNTIYGKLDDEKILKDFADKISHCTFESENTPAETVKFLSKYLPVNPGLKALKVCQDRLEEKQIFKKLIIPSAKFAEVKTIDDLNNAVELVGLPAILKTTREGYDGKGQLLLKDKSQLTSNEVLNFLSSSSQNSESPTRTFILEEFLSFDRELSLAAVRDLENNILFYPLSQNFHHQGILRISIAPAQVSQELETQAQSYLRKLLEELDYYGLITLEMFCKGDKLWGNEIAPRVHNSYHHSMEGAITSQFENHLRAISGLSLGATEYRNPMAMVNLISNLPNLFDLIKIKGLHLHIYGKEPKQNRKLGHLNIEADSYPKLFEKLNDPIFFEKNLYTKEQLEKIHASFS